MAQINSEKELRHSAHVSTRFSRNRSNPNNTLTHEQQVIEHIRMNLHLIALKHNSTNCLQNQTVKLNCWEKTSVVN